MLDELATSMRLLTLGAAGFLAACSGGHDAGDGQGGATPHVQGCNTVVQGSCRFTLRCEPGVAGYDSTIEQGGCTGHFHVSCSGGCVATVTANDPKGESTDEPGAGSAGSFGCSTPFLCGE